jgi:hypothetical protein
MMKLSDTHPRATLAGVPVEPVGLDRNLHIRIRKVDPDRSANEMDLDLRHGSRASVEVAWVSELESGDEEG